MLHNFLYSLQFEIYRKQFLTFNLYIHLHFILKSQKLTQHGIRQRKLHNNNLLAKTLTYRALGHTNCFMQVPQKKRNYTTKWTTPINDRFKQVINNYK